MPKNPKKPFVMPPTAFSNAICNAYPTNPSRKRKFSLLKWQDSPEWKLFNAGMAAAMDMVSVETITKFREAAELSRVGGFPRK